MTSHIYKFNVQMGCGGCSSAIQDALKPVDGIDSVDFSLEHQTVFVVARQSLTYDTVLATIKSTGKNVRSGEANGESKAV